MIEALGFLTVFGGARPPSAAAAKWFPAVGLLVGLAVGGVWWAAGELWPPAVAAALVILADLAITGMLHVDGLVDSGDGLLPHLDRDRRLAVMAEPTVGAFGVVVAVVVLLLRWTALATMAPDIWLVAGLWVLSRTLMTATLTWVPYARAEGLASAFHGSGWASSVILGSILAAALVGTAVGLPAFVIVVVAVAGGSGAVLLALRRLGGYTGDVLGAAGVIVETVGLVVASARW